MPGLRLGVEERESIALGLARAEPFAEIARRMGRPTSTVAREVGRCGGRGDYRGRVAQRLACERARRPKTRRLVANEALAAVVAEGLGKRWSPAEVSARLVLNHPGDEAMRVSHETRDDLHVVVPAGPRRAAQGADLGAAVRAAPAAASPAG